MNRAARFAVCAHAGRYATLTQCPRCGDVILLGRDGDVCYSTARADMFRLDVAGELAAVTAGLRTYDLYVTASRRAMLIPRDAHRMRGLPADEVAVVKQHRCQPRQFAELDLSPLAAGPNDVVLPDEPPF